MKANLCAGVPAGQGGIRTASVESAQPMRARPDPIARPAQPVAAAIDLCLMEAGAFVRSGKSGLAGEWSWGQWGCRVAA